MTAVLCKNFYLAFGTLLGQTLQAPGDSFLIGGLLGGPLGRRLSLPYPESTFTFSSCAISVLLPNVCFLLTLTDPLWLPSTFIHGITGTPSCLRCLPTEGVNKHSCPPCSGRQGRDSSQQQFSGSTLGVRSLPKVGVGAVFSLEM